MESKESFEREMNESINDISNLILAVHMLRMEQECKTEKGWEQLSSILENIFLQSNFSEVEKKQYIDQIEKIYIETYANCGKKMYLYGVLEGKDEGIRNKIDQCLIKKLALKHV